MSNDDFLFRYLLTKVLPRVGDTRILPTVDKLPENVAALVGQIITLWSQVEWLVKSSSYPLLGLTAGEGRIAVRDPRIEDHITMIRQLLSLRGLSVACDFAVIQKELREIASKRDLLAHGAWFEDENHALYIQDISGTWRPDPKADKVSRRAKPHGVAATPEFLEALLARIQSVRAKANEMNAKIVRAAASSPRIWPQQSPKDRPPDDSR